MGAQVHGPPDRHPTPAATPVPLEHLKVELQGSRPRRSPYPANSLYCAHWLSVRNRTTAFPSSGPPQSRQQRDREEARARKRGTGGGDAREALVGEVRGSAVKPCGKAVTLQMLTSGMPVAVLSQKCRSQIRGCHTGTAGPERFVEHRKRRKCSSSVSCSTEACSTEACSTEVR